MSYKLTITVTKEILEKSKYCGEYKIGYSPNIMSNCAIALAVRDIFPDAKVGATTTNLLGYHPSAYVIGYINNPLDMIMYISTFDNYTPERRLELPEASFEIDVPDDVIDKINIDSIKPLLENHPTLKLQEV